MPEEDTETEAESDHWALVDGCAEPVYDAVGLKEPESEAEGVAALLDEAVGVFPPVGVGCAEKVAVSVRLRLSVGLADCVRLCGQVRYRVSVGV